MKFLCIYIACLYGVAWYIGPAECPDAEKVGDACFKYVRHPNG